KRSRTVKRPATLFHSSLQSGKTFVSGKKMLACGGFWRFTAFRFRNWRQRIRPPTKIVETPPPVDKEERARKRIALFRSLFRGRENLYARRWENDDGRHGYAPAAVKDWKAINKSRPEEVKAKY